MQSAESPSDLVVESQSSRVVCTCVYATPLRKEGKSTITVIRYPIRKRWDMTWQQQKYSQSYSQNTVKLVLTAETRECTRDASQLDLHGKEEN